jgi:hypothetical protein
MHTFWEGIKPLIVMLVLITPGMLPGLVMFLRRDK